MTKMRTRTREHETHAASSQKLRQETATPSSKSRRKKTSNSRSKTTDNLLMPSMVALGCWGLAFSFIFLTSDSNHYLYGGMAIIMALMWTVMVGMRVTRMRRVRQNVHQ